MPAPRCAWLRLLRRRRSAMIGASWWRSTAGGGLRAPHRALGAAAARRQGAPGPAHRRALVRHRPRGPRRWSRVVYGARLSMLVGGSVMVLSFVGGLIFGLLGGYYRPLDNVLMRIMDGLMAFPGIILAIALMASLGPSVVNVIVALGVVYVPRVARIVRGSVLVIRETPYVEAARALGVPRHAHAVRGTCCRTASRRSSCRARSSSRPRCWARPRCPSSGSGVPPQIPSWGNVLAEGRALPAAGALADPVPGRRHHGAASSGSTSSATACAICSTPRCRASAARRRSDYFSSTVLT